MRLSVIPQDSRHKIYERSATASSQAKSLTVMPKLSCQKQRYLYRSLTNNPVSDKNSLQAPA